MAHLTTRLTRQVGHHGRRQLARVDDRAVGGAHRATHAHQMVLRLLCLHAANGDLAARPKCQR